MANVSDDVCLCCTSCPKIFEGLPFLAAFKDMHIGIMLCREDGTYNERNPTPHGIFLNIQDSRILWLDTADSPCLQVFGSPARALP